MASSVKAASAELRLLTALAVDGRCLQPDGQRYLVTALDPAARPRGRPSVFARDVVARLLSSGAVREVTGAADRSLVLSSEGRASLRRMKTVGDDGFGAQHGRRESRFEAGVGDVVTFNTEESPLLWLHRRKGKDGAARIGDAEFAAGERLRADLTRARLMPSMGCDWQRPGRSGVAIGLLPSEARLAAQQRVDRAMQAVGPEFSGLLVDVCGFLKGLDQVERERLWPARSAKVVLCLALAALARHYGYGNAARGPRHSRGVAMWGAADYRPEFSSPAPAAHQP